MRGSTRRPSGRRAPRRSLVNPLAPRCTDPIPPSPELLTHRRCNEAARRSTINCSASFSVSGNAPFPCEANRNPACHKVSTFFHCLASERLGARKVRPSQHKFPPHSGQRARRGDQYPTWIFTDRRHLKQACATRYGAPRTGESDSGQKAALGPGRVWLCRRNSFRLALSGGAVIAPA